MKMFTTTKSVIASAACAGFVLLSLQQSAVAAPVGPEAVSGKEFSTNVDTNASGVPKPGQTLHWISGQPDSFENGILHATLAPNANVDALANGNDAYFHEVVSDDVYLLFNVGNEATIRWEAPKITQAGIWGTPPQSTSTDALEVWGGDGAHWTSDPNATSTGLDGMWYSLNGDYPHLSIYGPVTGIGPSQIQPTFSGQNIANAIGEDSGNFADYIDVDALMVSGDGRYLMFSIAPVSGAYDGGEIWVWDTSNGNSGAAQYLVHGGHTWNTAFDVTGTYGLSSENVTVLEAVPIPEADTYTFMALGMGLVGWLARRKQHSA